MMTGNLGTQKQGGGGSSEKAIISFQFVMKFLASVPSSTGYLVEVVPELTDATDQER